MKNEIISSIINTTQRIDNFLDNLSKLRTQIANEFVETLEPNHLGLLPTIDINGRLHAPTGGWTEDYNGILNTYIGGEYLPSDDLEEKYNSLYDNYGASTFSAASRTRIKMTQSEFKEISNNIPQRYVRISMGATWDDNGTEVGYVYFETTYKSIMNDLLEIKNKIQAKIDQAIEQERIAIGNVAIEGKHSIEATVIKIGSVPCAYNGSRTLLYAKMDNGCVVIGTLPKSLYDVEQNQRVSFTATFDKHPTNEQMSYFKRPTKAIII